MAFSKTNAAVATPPPAAEVAAPVAAQTVPAEVIAKAAAPRTAQGAEDKKIKGQVAMHAIVSGYNAASRLVLTLAPKPEEARTLLHTLAAEIAAKVEAYSFHE